MKDEIFQTFIIQSTTEITMTKYGFGHRFHDLEYFEVGIFVHLL
jgi:hypothetical protein